MPQKMEEKARQEEGHRKADRRQKENINESKSAGIQGRKETIGEGDLYK